MRPAHQLLMPQSRPYSDLMSQSRSPQRSYLCKPVCVQVCVCVCDRLLGNFVNHLISAVDKSWYLPAQEAAAAAASTP